jgi:hypothetical protein
MKSVTLEFFSPDLKGKCEYTGHGRASNAKAAISRAFGDVYKQLKGRRIQTVVARISIVEVKSEPENKS